MDNRPIGIFDSGLGGLTTVAELHRLLPEEKVIYIGDTARTPYGSKSPETIRKFAGQIVDYLIERIQNGVREKIYLPWDKLDEKYNYLFENQIDLPKIKFDDDVKKANPEIVKEWESFYKRFCEDFSKRKSMKDVLSKAKFVMSWQSVRDIKEKLEKDNNLIFKHLDFLYDIY